MQHIYVLYKQCGFISEETHDTEIAERLLVGKYFLANVSVLAYITDDGAQVLLLHSCQVSILCQVTLLLQCILLVNTNNAAKNAATFVIYGLPIACS